MSLSVEREEEGGSHKKNDDGSSIETRVSRVSFGHWAFDGPRPEDGAISRWASLSLVFRNPSSSSDFPSLPFEPVSSPEASLSAETGGNDGDSKQDEDNDGGEEGNGGEVTFTPRPADSTGKLMSKNPSASFGVGVAGNAIPFSVRRRPPGPDEAASESGESHSSLSSLTSPTFPSWYANDDVDVLFFPLSADGENREFASERAKWQAYFSGLRLATKTDENKNADRSSGPLWLLAAMSVLCMCNYLPLLVAESTGRKEAWNVYSVVFQVVVALTLGSCLPTLVELWSSIGEQFLLGEEPEGLLYLSLARFLFIATHLVNYSVILITALTGQISFSYYSCMVNNWHASKVVIFVFFSAVHLPHWSLSRYFALFSLFSVTVGMLNYANLVAAYSWWMLRVVYPLMALSFISHVYYAYSVFRAVKAGKYRSRNGSLSVPVVMVIMFQVAIGSIIILEIFLDLSISSQRFSSYPLWRSCLGPIDRTFLIVLVAVLPIRLSRLLAQKTRRFMRSVAELEMPAGQTGQVRPPGQPVNETIVPGTNRVLAGDGDGDGDGEVGGGGGRGELERGEASGQGSPAPEIAHLRGLLARAEMLLTDHS